MDNKEVKTSYLLINLMSVWLNSPSHILKKYSLPVSFKVQTWKITFPEKLDVPPLANAFCNFNLFFCTFSEKDICLIEATEKNNI